jgi:hypothetical protein
MLLAVPKTQQLQSESEHRAFLKFVDFASGLANFGSADIWNIYALQMSHAEPAVHYITLSIGNLLCTPESKIDGSTTLMADTQQEQRVLYYYGKALHAVATNTCPDSIVVLLSTLVFCLFEELRGNSYAAIQHIAAGRAILLNYLQKKSRKQNNLFTVKTSSTWDPLLFKLFQVFFQLEMNTAILESKASTPQTRLPLSGFSQHASIANKSEWLKWEKSPVNTNVFSANGTFIKLSSITDASQSLAEIAETCLAIPGNCFAIETIPSRRSRFLLPSQSTIFLNQWLEAFNHLVSSFSAKDLTQRDLVDLHILRGYHSCLVLADQATHLGQEMVFDDSAVVCDLNMFRLVILSAVTQEELIPLLFFMATRCRSAYMRPKAVDLLRQCGSEGQFLSHVAERIIDIEESHHRQHEPETYTESPIPEVSRVRIHDIVPADVGQDEVCLVVSSFPYFPKAPTRLVLTHLPIVWGQGEDSVKGRIYLNRAIRFQMYSPVS